ncbi:MAG: hypothetical protein LBD49_01245 [Oscillospiraceae bacterium]|jgi:hypothetical protein|nr:hypothetical protein [Oscillospiraceae bacterium]
MGVFIAVALILGLMNVLFFYLLLGAARRLGRFSRQNMLREASVFDELLENKELELKALVRKIEEEKARLAAENPEDAAPASRERRGAIDVFALMNGRYTDKSFAAGYQALRSRFPLNKEACVNLVRGAAAGAPAANPAAELLGGIPIDTRYRLSLLEKEEAFAVLRDSVTEEQRRLLEDYRAREDGDVVAFFNWLEVRAFLDSGELIVRTGDPSAAPDAYGNGSVTQYDPGVCEGVYIVSGGRMYDFSIKGREISG